MYIPALTLEYGNYIQIENLKNAPYFFLPVIKKSFKPRPFFLRSLGMMEMLTFCYALNKVQWDSQYYQAVLSLVEIFVFIFF